MKKIIPWLMLVLSFANGAALALYIKGLPDGEFPVHFDINGTPDRYGSKWEMLAFSAVAVLLAVGYIVYRIATKNKENVQKNAKYEDVFIPIIIAVMCAIPWGITLAVVKSMNAAAPAAPADTSRVLGGVLAGLGLLMAFTSNISGKIAPNKTFGLRTWATLSDERVWRKAHRLQGYMGLAGSLVTIGCGLAVVFGAKPVALLMGIGLAALIVFGVIVPAIYADVLYKKLNSGYNKENTENTEE